MPIPTLPKWFAEGLPPRQSSSGGEVDAPGCASASRGFSTSGPRTSSGSASSRARHRHPQDRILLRHARKSRRGEYGKGRGTVDCCYPVKCMSGPLRRTDLRRRRPQDRHAVLADDLLAAFLPAAATCVDSLSCPRVMAAPENIKAGFIKEARRLRRERHRATSRRWSRWATRRSCRSNCTNRCATCCPASR